MNVVVNLSTLRGFGSSWVGRGLLEGISRLPEAHRYLVCVPRGWNHTLLPGGRRIRYRHVDAGVHNKLLTENLTLQRVLRHPSTDRLLSTGDTGPLRSRVPQLLMVQQAHLAYRSDQWGYKPTPRMRAKFELMAAYFRSARGQVQHYTVQTQDMKQKLAARWDISPDKISVIPSAIPISGVPDGHVEERLPGDPAICYVAGPGAHKNHAVLVDAVAELRKRFANVVCHLTIAPGQAQTLRERARRLDVWRNFELHGAVPRERALELMRRADVIVIPSLLESFGFSYYEALAMCRPVVVSDLPFAHEACEDAALYATASSGEQFASQMTRVLDAPELALQLVRRGETLLSRKKREWQQVASDYLSLLLGIC